MILAIYIVFFFFLYKYYGKKKNRLTHFVALVYLLSAIGSVYVYTFTDTFRETRLSIWAILFHCLMYMIIFMSINTVEKSVKTLENHRLSIRTYKILFYFLVLSSLVSFYDSVMVLRSINILDAEAIGERRFDLSTGNITTSTNALLEYIKGPSSILNGLKIALFFYTFINFKKLKKYGVVLLLCSLTAVVQNLTISGRNAMANWMILLLLNYIYFKPYLSDKFNKGFKVMSFALLPVISLPFVVITVVRFSYSEQGLLSGIMGSVDDILTYFSEGFITFSDFFNYFTWPTLAGKNCFPLIFGSYDAYRLNETLFTDATFSINSFSTMIGSFLMDFGILGTAVLIAISFLVTKALSVFISRDKTIVSLVILFMYFEITTMGLFYFMYFSPMFQKIFIVLLMLLFFNAYKKTLVGKTKQPVKLKKTELV